MHIPVELCMVAHVSESVSRASHDRRPYNRAAFRSQLAYPCLCIAIDIAEYLQVQHQPRQIFRACSHPRRLLSAVALLCGAPVWRCRSCSDL